MNFEKHLELQIKMHPSAEAQDIVKLCYQAARGGEHMLGDIEGARKYFNEEFCKTHPCDIPLYEEISDEFCRVNIAAWKYRGLSADLLFDIFLKSAEQTVTENNKLAEYIDIAEKSVYGGKTGVTPGEWAEFVSRYKKSGMPTVHHSTRYRLGEKPSYRVVRTCFVACESYLQNVKND